MPTYRSLARNRDFSSLWLGQTVSELGTRASMVVLPLVAYALTGSVLLAGLVEGIHLLGLAGAVLPAGVLADRVDRRLLMRATAAAGLVLHGSLALAVATGTLTLPHLVAVALLTGAAAGVFMPAELSAVRSVVPREELTTALSQNQARQHVAALVGGPAGGALYGVVRWLPFAADAASYAVSWLLLGRIRTDLSPTPRADRSSAWTDLRSGAAYVARHPLFRTLAVWAFLTNLAFNALFTVAVLRLVAGGVDPLHLGLVDAVAGLAGILGAVVAPWVIDRVPTGLLTVAVSWSALPLVVPMAVWGHAAVVAAALAGVVLLNPMLNAGMASYRLTVTPPDLVGRVQSITQLVGLASLPLAPLLGGVLLATLGGPGAVLATGALCGVVALVPTLARCVRSVPRPAAWPTAGLPGAVH